MVDRCPEHHFHRSGFPYGHMNRSRLGLGLCAAGLTVASIFLFRLPGTDTVPTTTVGGSGAAAGPTTTLTHADPSTTVTTPMSIDREPAPATTTTTAVPITTAAPVTTTTPPPSASTRPIPTTTTLPPNPIHIRSGYLAAVQDQPFAATLEAEGGTGDYRWTSADLPWGLSLDEDGTLSGAPFFSGEHRFEVAVTDGWQTASRTVVMTVEPAGEVAGLCDVETLLPRIECEVVARFTLDMEGVVFGTFTYYRDSWDARTWRTGDDPCGWTTFVQCVETEGEAHVTGLVPGRQGHWYLEGDLPGYLVLLEELDTLNFDLSPLGGVFPEVVLGMPGLKVLSLDRPIIPPDSGPGHIPGGLSALTELERLVVTGWGFSGEIPDLSAAKALLHLDLSGNELTGPLPSWLAGAPELVTLHLNDNRLSGTTPAFGGADSKLAQLALSNNQLSGTFAHWGALPQLTSLDLAGNEFTGPIPDFLQNSPGLRFLDLSGNGFTGGLPDWMPGLTDLYRLDLSKNRLGGELPGWLGNLTFSELDELHLSHNDFEGEIPSGSWGAPVPKPGGGLQRAYDLRRLALDHNRLSGEIPESLGLVTSLVTLYLDDNQLEGSIPAAIGNLDSISRVDLSNNRLAGVVPDTFSDDLDRYPGSLYEFDLSGNGCLTSSRSLAEKLYRVDPAWTDGCAPLVVDPEVWIETSTSGLFSPVSIPVSGGSPMLYTFTTDTPLVPHLDLGETTGTISGWVDLSGEWRVPITVTDGYRTATTVLHLRSPGAFNANCDMASVSPLRTDCEIVVNLLQGLTLADWSDVLLAVGISWDDRAKPCDWYFIECAERDGETRIVGIVFDGVQFDPSAGITGDLYWMPYLEKLVIRNAGMSGVMLLTGAWLPHIEHVNLSGNEFTWMSDTVGYMKSLRVFKAGLNRLSGVLPDSLMDLPIEVLELSGNMCLTASPQLAAWLSEHDPDWDDGCPSD